jgi:hypothetical protein
MAVIETVELALLNDCVDSIIVAIFIVMHQA